MEVIEVRSAEADGMRGREIERADEGLEEVGMIFERRLEGRKRPGIEIIDDASGMGHDV